MVHLNTMDKEHAPIQSQAHTTGLENQYLVQENEVLVLAPRPNATT